jgi:hypothetical protein
MVDHVPKTELGHMIKHLLPPFSPKLLPIWDWGMGFGEEGRVPLAPFPKNH